MTSNGKMYTTVMEKLNFAPGLDASNITVSVQGDHDIIILGGKVSSYNEKVIAEKAVKNLAHVRSIANEIEVDLATKYKLSDVDIAKDVTHALKSTVPIADQHIQSVVKGGIVTLSGEVRWHFQKQTAFTVVQNLIGIKSIINKISVKSPVKIDASTVKERITREFERHARLDASKIDITVDGTTVTLDGKARSFSEIEDAEDAAWSIAGVEEVENNIMVGW